MGTGTARTERTMKHRGNRTPREKVSSLDVQVKTVETKAEHDAEEYQCTGLLEKDFPELCAQAGITGVPKVTLWSPPSFPEDEEEPTEATLAEVLERIERKYSHFQPCIQVEREQEDPRNIRAVSLRGWKVEENMLGVLSRCLPALAGLQALHLWKVGLTEQLLPTLAALPSRCPGLRTLSLEGNPLSEPAFHTLMGSDSTLAHLSLRHNNIGDAGALLIGQSLNSNHNLISLRLAFNHISDLGARYIAEGLRLNRSLLSLSLSSNNIGDAGATRLAEVLAPLALTHAEVVQRRQLLFAEALKQPRMTPKEINGHSENRSSLSNKLHQAKQGNPPSKKKDALLKEESKHFKKLPEIRVSRSREVKVSSQEKRSQETPDPAKPLHPLLEDAREHQGNIILLGNRALRNLNLTHNHITERGLGAFLAALELQQQEKPRVPGQQGLLCLSLERNRIPGTSAALARLRELLPVPVPSAQHRQEQQESGSGTGT